MVGRSTASDALSSAQDMLALRRHRDALFEAATCLNALACPASLRSPKEDQTKLLPPLLPLPDDESLLDLSATPMAVLLQAACELDQPQLVSEALASCYVDVATMPYAVLWLGAQALSRARQSSKAAGLVDAWLTAQILRRSERCGDVPSAALLTLTLSRLLLATEAPIGRRMLKQHGQHCSTIEREQLEALVDMLHGAEVPRHASKHEGVAAEAEEFLSGLALQGQSNSKDNEKQHECRAVEKLQSEKQPEVAVLDPKEASEKPDPYRIVRAQQTAGTSHGEHVQRTREWPLQTDKWAPMLLVAISALLLRHRAVFRGYITAARRCSLGLWLAYVQRLLELTRLLGIGAVLHHS